jgi:hypothetical protein
MKKMVLRLFSIRSSKNFKTKNLFLMSSLNILTLIQISIIILLISRCESKEKFYRPNLPEKLSCIGIIDVDDTTEYISPIPDLLDSINTTRRYVSFERSYQSEYLEEKNDSLRDFSFSISSSQKTLFSYHSDSPLKDLKNLKLPNNLLFISGGKYYLNANEKDTPKIVAEILVPERPSEIKLISINKEIETIAQNQECRILNNQITQVTIGISFQVNREQRLFYALLLEGRGANIDLPPYLSGNMDFTIRDTNVPGFFAIIHGMNMYHQVCKGGQLKLNGRTPPVAYFIEGSKIPQDKCNIIISAQFHDGFSLFDFLVSLRVKLLSIPKELYFFEKSLYTYGKTLEDPFTEPIYTGANIKGGFGVFAICRSTELKINLFPPF